MVQLILCTEKSQTFKMIKTDFLSFIFHNDWLQNHCWLSVKSTTPNFVVVFNVLLSFFCHIGSSLPYLRIFVAYNLKIPICFIPQASTFYIVDSLRGTQNEGIFSGLE